MTTTKISKIQLEVTTLYEFEMVHDPEAVGAIIEFTKRLSQPLLGVEPSGVSAQVRADDISEFKDCLCCGGSGWRDVVLFPLLPESKALRLVCEKCTGQGHKQVTGQTIVEEEGIKSESLEDIIETFKINFARNGFKTSGLLVFGDGVDPVRLSRDVQKLLPSWNFLVPVDNSVPRVLRPLAVSVGHCQNSGPDLLTLTEESGAKFRLVSENLLPDDMASQWWLDADFTWLDSYGQLNAESIRRYQKMVRQKRHFVAG